MCVLQLLCDCENNDLDEIVLSNIGLFGNFRRRTRFSESRLAVQEPFFLVYFLNPVSLGTLSQKTEFMVDCRKAGRGNLTGSLTGVKYHTDVEIKEVKNGQYACHYLVPEAGAYILTLKWNGNHIPGSPYKVTIREAEHNISDNGSVEGQ